MKMTLKKGLAIGSLAIATAALLAVTDYTNKHRVIEFSMNSNEAMSSDFEMLEKDFAAQEEAQSIALAISGIERISLTSYADIQEARALYDHASAEAKGYINEADLLEAEATYEKLENERQEKLLEAERCDDLEGILDYAPCSVQGSGNEYLDELVQSYIDKATTPDMSRSEKLTACYDYMVANYDYDSNYNYDYSCGRHSVAWAVSFLRDGYGTCNQWSSAFMYVSKALGYDAELYYGATASSRGGSTEHYWPVIHVNGTSYIFDPQVERDMTRKSGINSHRRFGLYGESADAKYYFSNIVD